MSIARQWKHLDRLIITKQTPVPPTAGNRLDSQARPRRSNDSARPGNPPDMREQTLQAMVSEVLAMLTMFRLRIGG